MLCKILQKTVGRAGLLLLQLSSKLIPISLELELLDVAVQIFVLSYVDSCGPQSPDLDSGTWVHVLRHLARVCGD